MIRALLRRLRRPRSDLTLTPGRTYRLQPVASADGYGVMVECRGPDGIWIARTRVWAWPDTPHARADVIARADAIGSAWCAAPVPPTPLALEATL